MISPKWFVFMLFVWITLTFLGATLEQHNTSATWEGNTQTNTLSYLMDMKNVFYENNNVGGLTFVLFNPNYFKTLLKCATWDFDFMQTDIGNMVRWILFIPFSIAFIAMLLFEFVTLIQGFIPFT